MLVGGIFLSIIWTYLCVVSVCRSGHLGFMCVCMCVCVCVCLYVCMSVCLYVCMYVCMLCCSEVNTVNAVLSRCGTSHQRHAVCSCITETGGGAKQGRGGNRPQSRALLHGCPR